MKHPELTFLAPEGKMLVAGVWRDPVKGQTRPTICPATRETIREIAEATQEDVDAAVEAAHTAFQNGWRDVPAADRAEMLYALADRLINASDRLTLIEVVDNGSTVQRMSRDVGAAARMVRAFAGLAGQLRGSSIPVGASMLAYTVREPYGVVAAIAPFNHPIIMAAAGIGVAVASGNTLVIKPSEHTSLSTLEVGELAREIFPAGVLNVVTGAGGECGARLVEHRHVKRVTFTGSLSTGRAILETCSRRMIPVGLELGGKNPMIVCPDADVDAAIKGAVSGLNLAHQGQSCGAATRILVHNSLLPEFRSKLVEAFEAIEPGWPWEPTAQMGAMVSEPHYERVLGYIDLAKEEGATILAGGGPVEAEPYAEGLYIRPTLLEVSSLDLRVAREEIFGPITCLCGWSEEDEAISMANDTDYGLTASVWTRDLDRAHRMASKIDAGTVWVNQHGARPLGVPTPARNESGWGDAGVLEFLEEHTQLKTTMVKLG